MFQESEIVEYSDITKAIGGIRIQRGMNYKINNKYNIFFMNTSNTALYSDQIEESGRISYEGHDVPKSNVVPDPKKVDQPYRHKDGTPTANGKFFDAAKRYKDHIIDNAEVIQLYEKIKKNSWKFKGFYKLIDARTEKSNGRFVFKFILNPVHIDTISEKEIDEEIKRNNDHFVKEILVSEEKRMVSTRKGQNSLRKYILINYSSRCAMCEINDPQLLIASHIIPWSEDKSRRGILENVICLCVLHDSLFEKGIITIKEDYQIQFSKEFLGRTKYSVTYNTFKGITSETLRLPDTLPYPAKELLISHRNKFITNF